MKQYTVKEVSDILGVNPRAVQKRCVRANLDMTKGVYLIPENVFKKWVAKKERTSNMTVVRPSTLEKENYVRIQEIGKPDYASISKRPQIDNLETEKLKDEINNLRSDLLSHNKLFRAMYDRIKSLESDELNEVAETIKEKLPEPPLQVFKSVHPEGKEIKNDKGEVIDKQPSMNDVNFQSNFNYYKNKDRD
jgi:hypothetical protein